MIARLGSTFQHGFLVIGIVQSPWLDLITRSSPDLITKPSCGRVELSGSKPDEYDTGETGSAEGKVAG